MRFSAWAIQISPEKPVVGAPPPKPPVPGDKLHLCRTWSEFLRSLEPILAKELPK